MKTEYELRVLDIDKDRLIKKLEILNIADLSNNGRV